MAPARSLIGRTSRRMTRKPPTITQMATALVSSMTRWAIDASRARSGSRSVASSSVAVWAGVAAARMWTGTLASRPIGLAAQAADLHAFGGVGPSGVGPPRRADPPGCAASARRR